MERETKVVTLPSGASVTVYTYLTGGEHREYRSIFAKIAKANVSDIKEGVTSILFKGEIDGTILIEQEKVLVKSLVKECVGGVDNLRASDYDALVAELNKIKNTPLVPAK